MFESEDGTVVGSIDVSKLDQIEPKTDEARAQLDALKADVKYGQEQAARDADRVAEVARAQNPVLQRQSRAGNTDQGGNEPQGSDAEQREDATQTQAAADPNPAPQQADNRPRANASKDEWVAFAESQGMSREEAQAKSKADLQAQYGG